MRKRGNERVVPAALCALLLFALALRLTGISQHLPHALEDDALQADQASYLRSLVYGTKTELQAQLPQYPLALPALALLVPTLAEDPKQIAAPTAADHLARASERYLRMRLVVALVSLLVIPATFAIARRFLPPSWALLAAAFAATALLPTHLAQQARPHAGFLGTSALAMVALLHLRRRGGTAAYLWAGLATGLAVATLHFGFLLVPALCVAHALAPGRRASRLSLALCIVGASAWLAYPTLAGGFDLPWQHRSEIPQRGLHPSLEDSFHGHSFRWLPAEFASWDPALLAATIAGLVLGAAALVRGKRPDASGSRDLAVVLAFALPFGLLIGAFDRSPARFLLPLYPYFALLAALGVRELVSLARRTRLGSAAGPIPALAAVCAVLALPSWLCGRWAALRSAPDTPTLAARWLEEQVDREHETLATGPFLSLPLLARQVPEHPLPPWLMSPWERYLHLRGAGQDGRVPLWRVVPLPPGERRPGRRRMPPAPERVSAALSEIQPSWVALQRFHDGTTEPTLQAVLSAGGVLLVRFESEDRVAPGLGPHSFGRPAWLHVARSRRLGAPIEIYRMPTVRRAARRRKRSGDGARRTRRQVASRRARMGT